MNPVNYLQILQLAAPALRNLPPAALAPFLDTLDELVHADGRISTFEFALQKILTRTLALGADFPGAFAGVDEVVLAPVYAASEAPLAGGTSDDLARLFEKNNVTHVLKVDSLEAAWFHLRKILQRDDVLLVVGAGDVEKIAFWAKEFYGEKI